MRCRYGIERSASAVSFIEAIGCTVPCTLVFVGMRV